MAASVFTDAQLTLISDEAILATCRHLSAVYKRRQVLKDQAAVWQFRPGEQVEFIGRDSYRLRKGTVGKVERINERTVAVDFGGMFAKWRIPAQHLKKVMQPQPAV